MTKRLIKKRKNDKRRKRMIPKNQLKKQKKRKQGKFNFIKLFTKLKNAIEKIKLKNKVKIRRITKRIILRGELY